MNIVGDSKIAIEVVSGLVTFMDPSDLPAGVSPDCADVQFKPGIPGSVKTRPGLTNISPAGLSLFCKGITYLSTYVNNAGEVSNLYLNNMGGLLVEFPAGAFTLYPNNQGIPNSYAKSDTAFGSEFIAISDGKFGLGYPERLINGSITGITIDRVSQVGPGQAPSIVGDAVANIVSAARLGNAVSVTTSTPHGLSQYNIPISSASRKSNVVTIYLSTPFNPVAFIVGTIVNVVNVSDASFNASATITAILSSSSFQYAQAGVDAHSSGGSVFYTDQVIISGVTGGATSFDGTFAVSISSITATTFVYQQAGPDESANPNTGTSTAVGQVSAGVHQISILFITRNGYFTAPAPPIQWTAAGSIKALAQNIPIGPGNVIARLLIFTASGGANFFFSQSNSLNITTFLIPDNTTTSWSGDFTDLALLSSSSADLLFDRIELPAVAGMLQFSDRIIAWAPRNRVQNFNNLSFDGGVLAIGGYPLGWTVDGVFGAHGAVQISLGTLGFDYVISCVATGPIGMIWQSAYQDYLGIGILSPNISYSLRVNLESSGALNGNFTVDIYSPSTASTLATALIDMSTVLNNPGERIVSFNAAMPSVIPTDAILRVYANVISSTGQSLFVDNLEIFPTDEPFQGSVVYASNVADPEAFQGETGFMLVNENDGRSVRTAFVIRDRLYLVKNTGGLYVTTDDSTDEPSGWQIDTLSRRVGSESINSAGTFIGDVGEDWVFLFGREGLYIFWSTEPIKISQEIQPTWELINWNYAYKSWVLIDTANRRVLIGVPMGSATSPNVILQMDYQMLGSPSDIAESPAVSPTYTGQMRSHERSRKWTIWNIAARGAAQLENNSGQVDIRFGGASALYKLDDAATTDDGTAINGYYTTNFYPTDEQKQQQIQSQGDRIFLGMLTCTMEGTGDFECEVFGPGFVDSQIIPRSDAPTIQLSDPASQDIETIIDFSAERMALKFLAQNSATPQFSLQRADMYMAQDPVATLRGGNF